MVGRCVMHWKKDLATIHLKITKGNTFKYLSVMCRAYNINKFEFQRRMDSGWTWKMHLQCLQKLHIAKNIKVLAKRLFNDQKEESACQALPFNTIFGTRFQNATILIFSLIFETTFTPANVAATIAAPPRYNPAGLFTFVCGAVLLF